MWIARDKDGNLTLFKSRPIQDLSNCGWVSISPCESLALDSSLFPGLTWEDGPKEVVFYVVS